MLFSFLLRKLSRTLVAKLVRMKEKSVFLRQSCLSRMVSQIAKFLSVSSCSGKLTDSQETNKYLEGNQIPGSIFEGMEF